MKSRISILTSENVIVDIKN